jgi:hypothetical protein
MSLNVNQVFKIKEGQETAGLPSEVTITKIEGASVFISATDGSAYESNAEVLEAFYTPKEEFSAETLPKMSIEALDDIIAHFDLYASTESALAGVNVKIKLLALKDNIAKVAGIKSTAQTILGKKIA